MNAPEKRPTISVVELLDVTEQANSLGLKCTVLCSPLLAARVAPARVLERLRDALLATESDPQTALLRGIMLRGETAPRLPLARTRDWWDDVKRFVARAHAGIGGTNGAGDMMALYVDGELVIVHAGFVPHMRPIPRVAQRVFLTGTDTIVPDQTLLMPR